MSDSKYSCLVCKASKIKSYLTCTDHFVSHESFDIVQCEQCGFVFTARAPEITEMASYYKSEDYISHSDTQKGLVNKMYHRVRDIMLARKRKLIDREINGRKLLDIGCGTGYFINFMKQNGYQVSGMELDESARTFARNNFGLEVFHPNELLDKSVKQEYDAITLWHVLEHLHESEKYISWIKNALKDAGVLIIALPNCNSYDAKNYGKFWAAYDVPRHLWHFTPQTFEKYLTGFGFSLQKIVRLPFDAYYNSMMSARYAGKYSPLLHGLFTGFISNLLSLFKAQKTSSVIYILKKKAV